MTQYPLHFHKMLTSGTTLVRFVCLNTGMLSFMLRMVTRISKESLCRKSKARESKTKIRLLGADPDLQSDQRGWCKEHSWMGRAFAASPQCVCGLWVCSHSLPICRALDALSLTERGVCMSIKKRTSPHPGLWTRKSREKYVLPCSTL